MACGKPQAKYKEHHNGTDDCNGEADVVVPWSEQHVHNVLACRDYEMQEKARRGNVNASGLAIDCDQPARVISLHRKKVRVTGRIDGESKFSRAKSLARDGSEIVAARSEFCRSRMSLSIEDDLVGCKI